MNYESLSGLAICHHTTDRLRCKAPVVRDGMLNPQALQRFLVDQVGIESADVRVRTGSIIVRYDGKLTSVQAIAEILQQVAADPSDLIAPSAEEHAPKLRTTRHSEDRSSLTLGLVRVLALTGFMGYYLVRTFLLESPLSPKWVTLATVAGSLSLFQQTLNDVRQGRLFSVHLFLSSGSALALVTGQPAAALEVAWIREIGELLENYVQDRSRRQIRETLMVSARSAFALVNGVEVEIPVERIRSGDTVVVRSSERIPVDGLIAEGEALIDESHITGRAEPEHRKPGDSVKAGTILQAGMVQVQAQQVGEATYMARIVKRVEESLANRAEVEKQADLLAARLTRLGMLATTFTAVLTRDVNKTLAVLLAMTSPCATVLAASTAVTAGLANAARNGVLVKGGLHLERFREIDCVCFDKTGTVTGNAPTLAEIVPASPGREPREILGLAADAQANNSHPIAKSLVQAAISQGHVPRNASRTDLVLGRGVTATVNGHYIIVGNLRFMNEKAIDVTALTDTAARLEKLGHTNIYVAKDGLSEGLIGVAYDVKPGLDGLLDGLKADGVAQVHLVSGDDTKIAGMVAQNHGFDGFAGNMLPEDKAEYVEKLAAAGLKVAMIGDGINDALALSKARIGVAVGAGGSEAAIEASDIALVDGKLYRLIYLRHLSEYTLNIVEQNYWFAISTDVLGAALGLLGVLSPMMSGFSHVLHTCVIFLNSGRVLNWTSPEILRSLSENASSGVSAGSSR
jgi:heavy metal translocating P-type ATPase